MQLVRIGAFSGVSNLLTVCEGKLYILRIAFIKHFSVNSAASYLDRRGVMILEWCLKSIYAMKAMKKIFLGADKNSDCSDNTYSQLNVLFPFFLFIIRYSLLIRRPVFLISHQAGNIVIRVVRETQLDPMFKK